MEHLTQGMGRKWERHFRETKTTISIMMFLCGAAVMVSLFAIWPQKYFANVFNSRLKYNLMVDVSYLISYLVPLHFVRRALNFLCIFF